MNLKERVLTYMQTEMKKAMKYSALVEALNLVGEEINEFRNVMDELEREQIVFHNRGGKYGLPEHFNWIKGKLSVTARGVGFVIPDDGDKEGTPRVNDIFVPAENLNSAMNNDRVWVKVTTYPDYFSHTRKEGTIVKVIEHANKRIVGTFESSRTFGFVVPDNNKIGKDIFIEGADTNGAKVGMKVVVEITKWPTKEANPEGKIVEILGKVGDPGVDILSVMRQYDLEQDFPEAVQAEAGELEQSPNETEYAHRKDRRDLPIVTIDGEDAKDLDDGVFAEKLPNGNFFLGVYIADVSYYVKKASPLDREAYRRGTSVYLADRVVPMLPVELSNGICSLNAGTDRLSMCAEMEIDKKGKVVKYEITPAVIHVYRRLTYKLVNSILVEQDKRVVKDNKDILPLLDNLRQVREILHAKRQKRGSIDFDIPEIKVKLNEKGQAVGLIKREHGLGESIIEECMLVANETVAEHMARKNLPFLYRIHEKPAKEKMDSLKELLMFMNLRLEKNNEGEIEPKAIQKVLIDIKKRDSQEERIVSSVALRSMQQAKYSAENLGHFGLAAKYYTHFTSPIRRYPDLIVHRLLKMQLTGQMNDEQQNKLKSILPEIATHTSRQERIATEAERDTIQLKEIEYMAQFIGQSFDAVISGVTSFGLFVELDNGVEGLVHISTMINDYYEYEPREYALIGGTTFTRYRMGDSVRVTLTRASVKDKSLDFILKDNGRKPPMFEDDIIATPIIEDDTTTKRKRKSEKKSVKKTAKKDDVKSSSKKKRTKNENAEIKKAGRSKKSKKNRLEDSDKKDDDKHKKHKKRKKVAFYEDIYAKKAKKHAHHAVCGNYQRDKNSKAVKANGKRKHKKRKKL